jgi:hypothetical protein
LFEKRAKQQSAETTAVLVSMWRHCKSGRGKYAREGNKVKDIFLMCICAKIKYKIKKIKSIKWKLQDSVK